jgi:hypothetical protein
MLDQILGGGLPPGKSTSLHDRYCRSQGLDPATARAAAEAADRRYRLQARAVVSGPPLDRRGPDADALACLHHLVLTQDHDLRDLRRLLEAMRKEYEILRREVAKQEQHLRHLEEDLPEGIRVVVDQALEDRDAERGRP